jgi:hypothetical protein
MAQTIFEQTADGVEERTDLEKLEARGTVRLALKQAGLDAASVTARQMLVVLDQVLPGELEARGVERAQSVCEAIQTALKAAHPSDSASESDDAESPEAVFRRLARG